MVATEPFPSLAPQPISALTPQSPLTTQRPLAPQPHTGALLRDYLLSHPPARRRWQVRIVRQVPGLNQAAVCAVLGRHLVDIGERPCWASDRALKDTVSRALSGRLTGRTLQHFIDAFVLTPAQAQELWASMGAQSATG